MFVNASRGVERMREALEGFRKLIHAVEGCLIRVDPKINTIAWLYCEHHYFFCGSLKYVQ